MEKRTFIAIAISFLVLGFYPVILEKLYPGYHASSQKAPAPSSTTATGQKVENLVGIPSPVTSFSPEKDLEFKNDKLKILFNEDKGAIREI